MGLLAFVTVADSAVSDPQFSLFGAFIAVPLGWVAFANFVVRELDQSFANVYSTSVGAEPGAAHRPATVRGSTSASVSAGVGSLKQWNAVVT